MQDTPPAPTPIFLSLFIYLFFVFCSSSQEPVTEEWPADPGQVREIKEVRLSCHGEIPW